MTEEKCNSKRLSKVGMEADGRVNCIAQRAKERDGAESEAGLRNVAQRQEIGVTFYSALSSATDRSLCTTVGHLIFRTPIPRHFVHVSAL